MKNKNKASAGCRIFVPYDEWTDTGIILHLEGWYKGSIKVMIHKCQDNPEGVIFWMEIPAEKRPH